MDHLESSERTNRIDLRIDYDENCASTVGAGKSSDLFEVCDHRPDGESRRERRLLKIPIRGNSWNRSRSDIKLSQRAH